MRMSRSSQIEPSAPAITCDVIETSVRRPHALLGFALHPGRVSSLASSRLARLVLGLNAAFSTASGLLLSIFAETAARALFDLSTPPTATVRVAGILLVLFAGLVAFAAMRRSRAPGDVRGIAFADLGWVGGSVVLLAGFRQFFTDLGMVAVAGVACAVGAFAVGQLVGAARMRDPNRGASEHPTILQTRGRRHD